MPLINNLLGTGECKFRGIAGEQNYFEIRLDQTSAPFRNFNSKLSVVYRDRSTFSDLNTVYYFGYSDSTYQGVTLDFTCLNFYMDATTALYTTNDPAGSSFLIYNPTSGLGNLEYYNYLEYNHPGSAFDFRCKITGMHIPNDYADSTFSMFFGASRIGFNLNNAYIGFRIDSPIAERRRLNIEWVRNGTDQTSVIYSRTESFLGEFGDATILNNMIVGNVVKDLRFAKAGRKLFFEWNFDSDYTEYNDPNKLQKVFKNKVSLNINNNFNSSDFGLLESSYSTLGLGMRVNNSQIDNLNHGDYTSFFSVTRFDSVPVILLDTTNDNNIGDVLWYNDYVIGFLNKPHNEGFCNASIVKYGIPFEDQAANVEYTFYLQTPPNAFEFVRKEQITARTAQFIYNNQLDFAKTGDLKRDLYIDNINKNENSLSNIYPNIYCDKTIGKTDTTYKLTINKDGYIENLFEKDSTEFNAVNISNIFKTKNKLVYGRNNFPTYLFYDGTYNFGRSARFNFMDNVILTAGAGESLIRNDCKVFERDSTSYYISEVITDGTNFRVYTRIFNPYTKTLSSRVLVNTDTLIANKNPTFSYQGSDYETFNYTRLNPNPDIIVFTNKHICALTVDTNLVAATDVAYRLFYESFDNGTTWSFKNNSARNISRAGERNGEGQSHTFRLKDNDDYLFNFNGRSYLGSRIINFIHRKDNFAFRPVNNFFGADILNYSRLRAETIRFIKCAYDPIQKNISVCVGSSEGSLEVIKSPTINKDSVSNLDNRIVLNSWRSEFISKPFADGNLGGINASHDKNGDLIIIASKSDDDTSFAILRTNFAKDDINLMGRFMQVSDKAAARMGRSITNMFSDYNGDIIMSSASKDFSGPDYLLLNISKYGILTNETNELDLDDGFLSPQIPYLSSGNASLDLTTNGLFLDQGSIGGFNDSGTTISSIFKPLSNSHNLRGFKLEWNSFVEPIYNDITSIATRITAVAYGNELSATNIERHNISIGWDITSMWAYDNDLGSKLGKRLLDPKVLRKYMCVIERTSDNSAAGIIFTEDINLSNCEKIVYKTIFQWISPFSSTTTISDAHGFDVGTYEPLHIVYQFSSRNNTPRQFARKNYLGSIGESILSRSSTDYNKYNGITANNDITSYFSDGIQISWKGYSGVINDYFTFNLKSSTDPAFIFDKEPYKYFRSVSDNTSCVVAFDATEQAGRIQFIRGDTAVFRNVNFRRCFIEGHTSSLLNSATTPSYSKEVFFDLDGGTLFNNLDNYGEKTIVMCPGKNWRPSEHIGRFLQFETCRLDSTPFRHMAFKIVDNGVNSLNINTGNLSLDSTIGFRYYILDGNISVKLSDNTAKLNFWRVRIPPHQMHNPAAITDETAQGSVYSDGFREVGEFDIGRLTSFKQNIDEEIDISIESDVKTTEFENLSVVNYEFSRPRKIKKIRYSNGSPELMNEIKRIFIEMYGSGKTLWFFEDQKGSPRNFMLCRIMNEPEFEEVNDEIQNISIDLEEVV